MDRYRTATGKLRGELLLVERDETGAASKLWWATYPLTREPETFAPARHRRSVGRYSYWSASSGFSFAARRAGKIAARIPTITAAIAEDDQLPDREGEADEVEPRGEQAAEDDPEQRSRGRPPISAVMTLSWRIIRRTWRRVIPIARSIPSSRVRSKTVRTSVFTIPKRLMTTERPSRT